MATRVFTFHIAYSGLDDRIWRDVEVSSKMRLDQLGYVVLATFDTMAYHLFEIVFRGRSYMIPDVDYSGEQLDLADFTLDDLEPEIGERMELIYDFGTEQHFNITTSAVREMKRGEGRHYPWVTAMNGRGIIDAMPSWELEKLIAQIDENGKTDEPVYYCREGVDRAFLPAPWNVNNFDLKVENGLLKFDVEEIEADYAPFWEEKRLAAIHKAAVPKPRAKERAPLSERDICRNFFEAVLSQKPDKLRKLFQKNAVIEWPCTNERFTLEEYVRANCECPGEWDGEIVSVIPAEKQTVLITKVWPKDKTASFHCVSIIRAKKDKITGLTEYWADDGPVPQWRQELEGR